MEIFLCSGDLELLRDINDRKIDDLSSLNDSQRRSARYLYSQEFISGSYLKDKLEITALGKSRVQISGSQ